MSSEEEDYMSDTFLPKESNEVRPGLFKSKASHHATAVSAKKAKYDESNRAKMKPVKVLEEERRHEGLSSAITSQNKGFAMLAKMGYKQGEAIGKSSTGILEPIGIDIKTDRGGLGRDAALKQLKEHRQLIRMNRLKTTDGAISTDEFRKRMTQKAQGKQMEADLGKCQRACEKLDGEEKIEKPALTWFWPNRKTDEENEDEDKSEEEHESSDEDNGEEVEYELTEKLEMITNYLRTTYCYCHWCGTKYTDVEDLNGSCPGMTKDDH